MSKEISVDEMNKMINEAPEECLITGLRRCDSYVFEEGVVYLTEPAYDAYTLPDFDREDLSFSRVKIDMDADFKRDYEFLCNLSDIVNHENIDEIKKYYGITDDELKKASLECGCCQREDAPCDNCTRCEENTDKENPDLEDCYYHD